jgi:hypothetical protein
MERLDFALPPFTRITWVSDAAKQVWEPRLNSIISAWLDIERLSVAAGLRRCSITLASSATLVAEAGRWLKCGLCILPIELESFSYSDRKANGGPPTSFVFRLLLGAREAIMDFQRAVDSGDDQHIGDLLGHPPCCCEFGRRTVIEDGFEDTTWPMASMGAASAEQSRSVDISGPPEANILWRWMGVRAVPHLPCRADCDRSAELARAFVTLGERASYTKEMGWLLDVLSWPAEWSALHGIAEIKTPILKISTRTDATALKYVVRRQGSGYPPEGAQGLTFPYRSPPRPLLFSSLGFKRGLAHSQPSSST